MSEHEAEKGHITLFKSPLVHHTQSVHSSPPPASVAHGEEGEPQREHDPHDHLRRLSTRFALVDDDHLLHESPQFHHHTEATNAELFYDLFFVANLTVFTTVHDVNDDQTLAQYVGYFCILWFTWYQVGLYDVRFSMDSVFERVAKACQFGVMIGFAITGPKFDVGKLDSDEGGEGPSYEAFQNFTLILMASRLILLCQYVQSLWFTRRYKRTHIPMIAISVIYFVAAMIYLGLYWTFHPRADGPNNSYVAWYVVAVLETMAVTAIGCIWRAISFKGTHLIQRMSLLTLIILGEGVIGLAERCAAIVEAETFKISEPSTLGNICCSVLILYFLYMLYFDWIEEGHFGTIRQQLWAFLHFPLHLFLVLGVEAVSQVLSWNAATVASNELISNTVNTLYLDYNLYDGSTWSKNVTGWAAAALNSTAAVIIQTGVSKSKSYDDTLFVLNTIQGNVDAAVRSVANGASNATQAVNDAVDLFAFTLADLLYAIAGFIPPGIGGSSDSSVGSSSAAIDNASNGALVDLAKISNVFQLTFVYFFVSIGLVIIFNSLIAALTRRSKSQLHWIRLASTCFIGVALCLLAIIAITNSASSSSYAFTNYADSPYILPTVTLSLFAVVLINNVKLPASWFSERRGATPKQ